jgi:hypothetical protein
MNIFTYNLSKNFVENGPFLIQVKHFKIYRRKIRGKAEVFM